MSESAQIQDQGGVLCLHYKAFSLMLCKTESEATYTLARTVVAIALCNTNENQLACRSRSQAAMQPLRTLYIKSAQQAGPITHPPQPLPRSLSRLNPCLVSSPILIHALFTHPSYSVPHSLTHLNPCPVHSPILTHAPLPHPSYSMPHSLTHLNPCPTPSPILIHAPLTHPS